MSELNVMPEDIAKVQTLLTIYAPDAEVWAYGSRVSGLGHAASDLDLVLRNPADLLQRQPHLEDVRAAFSESNLPFLVDVLDWARIPETFRQEISRHYVVLRTLDHLHVA
jgi:DNA polymerase sigma